MNEKLIVTGVSQNIEWLLPWWLGNYKKHNDLPIVVFDFGLSDKALEWCKKKEINVQKPVTKCDGWFYKPTALREAKGKLKVWVDIDCEIRGDISSIFSFIKEDQLTCGIDRFHSWGCKYQSGVVGVKDDPKILQTWEKRCIKPDGPFARGDQELLWDIVKDDASSINILPEKYNWLRMAFHKLQGARRCHYDVRIIHWTGEIGKQILTKSIREKKNTIDIVNKM
jgi:hypothetical protein